METIERRALQREAMGLCLGAACKLSFWSERLDKMRAPSQAPKKALKLFTSVLTLPGSPLDRQSVIVFPLAVNDVGEQKTTVARIGICHRHFFGAGVMEVKIMESNSH
jgi:hypothetical protein